MTSKICKGCGNKIPRKIPHSHKKTNKSRQFCYNCSPIKSSNHYSPEHKTERRKRKEALIKMLGGKCVACGYNKTIEALSFHHIQPENKLFDISGNGNLMQDWDIVVAEAKKCEILCLNCHSELHNVCRDRKK